MVYIFDITILVITQVFPDEFHLNTLDQLLSAIARLNPHVNIKAIVIGLMDRLSSYDARESESEPQDDRKKTEEEATAQLLRRLKISKESKEPTPKETVTEPSLPNGDRTNGEPPTSEPTDASNIQITQVAEPAGSDETDENDIQKQKENRGIPENVKLYEIFYGQVTNLVNAQRLHIHDTIALLVSLTNLALYVVPQTSPFNQNANIPVGISIQSD